MPAAKRASAIAGWVGVALAVGSGLLQVAALPPRSLWPLAFVSAAPLLVATRGATVWRALLLGTVQGVVVVAVAGAWLPATIASFTQLSLPVSALLAILPGIHHGARTGLQAALFAAWERRGGAPALGWPVVVALTELAYPMLVPFYAAEQVTSCPTLCQLAEMGGPALVSLALAVPNVALARALTPTLPSSPAVLRRRRLALAILVPLALGAYGQARMRAVDAAVDAAPLVRIAVIQPNVAGGPRGESGALARAWKRTAERRREGAALVVWPESVFERIVDESAMDRWAAEAAAHEDGPSAGDGLLLVGAYLAPSAGPLHPSNALLLVDAEGSVRGLYRKRKRLMFGEYVPFADTFPALDRLWPRAGRLTAGTSFASLTVSGHRLAPLVCYEDLLPSFVREAVRADQAELLVDASNDAWFGRSSAWRHHLALSRFRAIEQRRFLVRAGNNAGSAVIDPAGRLVRELAPDAEGSLAADVRWLGTSTPYQRYGDRPLLGSCAAACLSALAREVRARWRRRRPQGQRIAPCSPRAALE